MKKQSVLIAGLALCLGVGACGSKDDSSGGNPAGRGGGGRGGAAGTAGRGGASGTASGGVSGAGASGAGGTAGNDGGSGDGGTAGDGGSAGSTGSSGSSGTTGSGGTSGTGGSGGTGGTSGGAGTSGTGGRGGTAGTGGGTTGGTGGVAGTGGSGGSSGNTYYVDPVNGSRTGNGSATNPWRTIEEVAADGLLGGTVKAGATVLLRNGYHGDPMITGGNYAQPITIAAESGHTPLLRRLRANNTQGFVFRGLSISPSHAPTYATVTMVDFQGSSSRITLENSQIFSVNDATSWAAADWVNRASSGVQVSGTQITIRGNHLRNVRFGISVSGTNAMIDRNTVENFSADGLRGLGNDGTFQYNVVKNSYADDSVDANHDDGFQSWSTLNGSVGAGEVRGIVLRGNTIINFENPNQPLKGTLQGIGCFDGFFVDWVVENNVVITNHWHGISLYGVRNSRVVNNTVIDNNSASPGPPWIMVTAHKDGRPSDGVTVRNNLATDYDVTGTNITQDHNTTLTAGNLATFFVNPGTFDLHLKAGAPAIDTGSATLAPAADRDGVTRPQGVGIDLGAYEFR
jgi:parallel beta-helix repeat protein